MMMHVLNSARPLFFLFALCGGFLSGCGGEKEGEEGPVGEEIAYGVLDYPSVANKLATCNLVTAGKFGDAGPFREEHCERQCLLQLRDCETVTEVYCSKTQATASERQVYEGCVTGCLEDLGSFACNNGSTISGKQQCDGRLDCAGGEDEASCGPMSFGCDGGKVYSVIEICDGARDCVDGTDEPAGCAVSRCAEH